MESIIISQITTTLIWLGFFAAIFLAYYNFLKFRNKERMILIEKDSDLLERSTTKNVKIPYYIIGYTCSGVGIGLFFSVPFMENFDIGTGAVASVSLALLFGGIGVLLGNKKQKKETLNG